MASFNRVILMGNLTRDPQLKYLPSNLAVCEFGIATNHKWRDREGNAKEEVCFVDCACFGKGGEIINQYMTKGSPLLVEGRLKYDSWTAQDGTKKNRLSVVVDNFQFVGGRRDGSEGGGAPARSQSGPERQGNYSRGGQGAPPPRNAEPAPAYENAGPPANDDIPPPQSEDIPF